MAAMTKEEAIIEMDLLKLRLKRIQKSIDNLLKQFCAKGDHDFRKVWCRLEAGQDLFVTTGYICVLCRQVEKPLEISGHRCPICNDKIEIYSEEDVGACMNCGFNNLLGTRGLPMMRIPNRTHDVIISLI